MLKKESVLILILIVVLLSSGSSVYGQRGLSWLQETFLPQPQESQMTVTGKISNGKMVLKWDTDLPDVASFAIVASRTAEEPRYPADGYLCFLDPNLRSYTIDTELVYQGGDVDGLFQVGETYFFSVTAITATGTTPGNGVAIKIPEAVAEEKEKVEDVAKNPDESKDKDISEKPKETTTKPPKVVDPQPAKPKPADPAPKKPDPAPEKPVEMVCRAWVHNNIIKMDWTQANDPQFQGYKVVISDTNKSPSYPQDGYLAWITNVAKNYTVVDNQKPYQGGSINGYLQPGKTYYFAVTYVYKDRKVTTAAVKLTAPETLPVPEPIDYVAPVVTTILDEGNAVNFNIQIHWTWDGDPTKGFKGFKAEITDMETGKVSHQHLGTTAGFFTLYCDGSGKDPNIEPYRYYKIRIIAVYEGKLIYSNYTRPVRSFGDTC